MNSKKYSKRRRLKSISITMEEETLKEVEEFTKKFKSLTRTEIIRFAVEFAITIKTKEFEKEMEQLDS